MQTAICPGSFDPLTLGHLDVITRAAGMFEHVVVLVVANVNKKCMFTLAERAEMAREATCHLPNVCVDTWDGLLAEYAVRHKNPVVIRGLRAVSDFEYEFMIALTNKQLNSDMETVFLACNEKYMYLSSSAVKEIFTFGGDVSRFVPPPVNEAILKKAAGRKD